MGYFLKIIVLLVALQLISPFISVADSFPKGERLVFDLSWYGVSGGTSVMEVADAIDRDHPVYKITSTTKSNRFISMFYPVNDVVESYVDIKSFFPHRYRSVQKEGNYRSNKEIIFDREKNTATFIDHKSGGKTRKSDIVPGAQDPLSVVYFFRNLPFEVGKDVNVEVHDGNKNWTLVVKVLKKEKKTTPAGTFDTIKVKALMRYEGLFVNTGDVFVWFTDDSLRIPVLMESKIKIGHVTATLIEKSD